ncbi:MAG: DUF2723 domain-containing protein [Gemmatimonadales bacterium]
MTQDTLPPSERSPYALAAVVSTAILGLYVATLAPTTQFWDTSEYMAAAKTLGIPHPPGNPLFVLLANLWGWLPLAENYGRRLNLFSAVSSALASGFLFLVTERFLRTLITDKLARYSIAVAGVLVGATAFTVWNQSVVNEKVYTLSLLSIGLVLWLGTRWMDRAPGNSRDKLLILILYLLALTSTNHTMGLLVAPAIMVLVLETLRLEKAGAGEWAKLLVFSVIAAMFVFLPSALDKGAENGAYYGLVALAIGLPLAFAVYTGDGRFATAAVVVAAMGLSLNFFFLLIRAGLYPPINEGEPTTWETLRAVLSRQQYQKGPLIPRQADIVWQYINYLQYFSWQFGRDWSAGIQQGLAALFGGLGLLGAVWHWLRDRRSAAMMTALMVTVTLMLVFYLDFKFGYSIRPGENLVREVRERDYFYIASFMLWGVWVAFGFAATANFIAQISGNDSANRPVGIVSAAPVLILCLIPLYGNHLSASRKGETLPRDSAWDMLQSVEPYGILITAGDNDTFPLWYVQEVEGVRRDVTLANLSLMNTKWHNRQIKRREIFPFDSLNALQVYRGRSWPKPTGPILSPSYEDLDNLPPFVQLNDSTAFQFGTLRATIPPQVLERSGIITLQLIRDNLGKRPIYLSRTTGNYGERMGLKKYLLSQGMVRKLMSEPIEPGHGITAAGMLGWVDVERSRALLFDVYHSQSAARQRPFGWIDRPSESILALYAILYASFAEILASPQYRSDSSVPDSVTAREITEATNLADRILRNTSFR